MSFRKKSVTFYCIFHQKNVIKRAIFAKKSVE